MGAVKPPSGGGTPAKRIAMIRHVLAPNVEDGLSWPDFERFSGVPLGTVKKWGDGTRRISEAHARELARRLTDAGHLTSWEWIRHGTPPEPPWVGERHTKPAPRSVRDGAPSGASALATGSSAPPDPLTGDQIATSVAARLAPLIEQLAAKGELVVARWLLSVAAEASDQGVADVKRIIDLARDYLRHAEHPAP